MPKSRNILRRYVSVDASIIVANVVATCYAQGSRTEMLPLFAADFVQILEQVCVDVSTRRRTHEGSDTHRTQHLLEVLPAKIDLPQV